MYKMLPAHFGAPGDCFVKDTKEAYKNAIAFCVEIVYTNYNYGMRVNVEWEN